MVGYRELGIIMGCGRFESSSQAGELCRRARPSSNTVEQYRQAMEDSNLKRLTAAGLALLMLMFMTTASASSPGSSADPLITRSYLEGAYSESLKISISQTIGGAADRAAAKLESMYRVQAGYVFAPRFTFVSLAAGESLTLPMGSSFILLSGSASLNVVSGTAVNVSTGNEAPSGTALAVRERYFGAENASIVVTAASAATGQVDGYYLAGGAGASGTHRAFYDVLAGNWFYGAVDYVYQKGLFQGTGANMFSPAMSMSRAMFVTVLHRLEGLPSPSANARPFRDVAAGTYYHEAVMWASENDIVTGYEDGTFRPDVSISREQMATLMYRYAEFKGHDMVAAGNTFDAFPDARAVSGYALDAMRWAVSMEIIRGSDGRLLPKDTATRAQVAQIFLNYDESIGSV